MEDRSIRTTLVGGFLDAGKTTYIQDCIANDFFHRRGSTLILCFEQGETEYDPALLARTRTDAAYYEGGEDITAFCTRCIGQFRPDRIFVEANAMTGAPRGRLPSVMKQVFSAVLIDGTTLPLYAANMRQLLQDLVAGADQVIFNRCETRDMLAPYSRLFRLMNRRASYLWESPMGYHEKAFDVFVPFDLDRPELELREEDYIPFILDALSCPGHYDGKTIRLLCQAEAREETGRTFLAGRTVMTCCPADLQFLGLPCEQPPGHAVRPGSWLDLTARAALMPGPYGQKQLVLSPLSVTETAPPAGRILQSVGT